jgi:hypothetical protein
MPDSDPRPSPSLSSRPEPRRRGWINGFIAGWLLLQIGVPASYYLSDRSSDERFSWRMFSSVRLQRCTVDVAEILHTESGELRRPLALEPVLHAAWIHMLKRHRPAVVHRFLATRCAAPDVIGAVYQRRCVQPNGEALAPERVMLRCGEVAP